MTASKQPRPDASESPVRERILEAALAAFVESGYSETSTLRIATRARVSKRELYALVGKKQEMLIACITERAGKLRLPEHMPMPRDRATLAAVLADFGAQMLREVSDPATIAVFRFAIAEADRAPEVAHALDSIGRAASRTALRDMLAKARQAGLLSGSPAEMAEQFMALLWGDLMMSLLLRVAERPSPHEIKRRTHNATAAFLAFHTTDRAE
jgi:AcrR family transcriptional regulator